MRKSKYGIAPTPNKYAFKGSHITKLYKSKHEAYKQINIIKERLENES